MFSVSLRVTIIKRIIVRNGEAVATSRRKPSSYARLARTWGVRAYVNRALALRSFAGALAFERPLATDVYLNLFRFGFGLLRQLDLQHALFIVGLDVVRVNCARECEAASEAAILPLDPAIVLFLLFLLEVALAMNGQG